VRRTAATLTVGALSTLGAAGIQAPAPAADFPGQVQPGYDISGVLSTGDIWLGALQNPNGDPNWLAWCTQLGFPAPTTSTTVTAATLTAIQPNGQPSDLTVTTPQMAWILENKEPVATAQSRAAISYLVHLNYETGNGSLTGAQRIAQLMPAVRAQHPEVEALAKQYVADAKNSGAVGYEKGNVGGSGTRHGTIKNITAKNAAGANVAGVAYEVTLNGPAVFAATGKKTATGTTTTSPITLQWDSTGNGNVTYSVKYKSARKTLTKYGADGSVQDTLSYGTRGDADPVWTSAGSGSFRVIYDFQPIAATSVGDSKIVDAGTLTDTITAKADPSYGDGTWLAVGGKNVAVKYEGTAYYTGDTPANESTEVPTGAKPVGATTITATGPGTYTASITGDYDPNFITWVWKVVRDNQGDNKEYVHADWTDHYGLADETTSLRHTADVESSAALVETTQNAYLTDTLYLSGFPSDHPAFAGGAGFQADNKTLQLSLYFFPKGTAPTDEGLKTAEQLGTVDVTLGDKSIGRGTSNGHYTSVGDESFKLKLDKNGLELAGTYVFITSFAGDDRVKPFTSSATDKAEQYEVIPEELSTTATDKADGDKTVDTTQDSQTLTDTVELKNLRPNKSYTLTATLMDAATGKPIQSGGKTITAEKRFTPTDSLASVAVDIDVPAAELAGKKTVVYEIFKREGKTVAYHEDPDDQAQTVWFPKITTAATATVDRVAATTGDKTTLTDTVTYTGLQPGVEYTLTPTLVDQATSKPIDDVSAAPVAFTPTNSSGTQKVSFTVAKPADIAGRTTVVYETLARSGKTLAIHQDRDDSAQTVWFPSLATSALSTVGQTAATTPIAGATFVTDTVSYAGLQPGQEYTLTGTVMDASTGKPIAGATAKPATFTPSSSSGTQKVSFTVAKPADIAGRTTVVYETLSVGDIPVATHNDPADQAQTVWFPKITTTARATANQVAATTGDKTVITDTVTYQGLQPGVEYTLTPTLVDQATGKPIDDVSAAPVKFTPKTSSGAQKAALTVNDPEKLAGRTTVVYETLKREGAAIAAHADLADQAQTVWFPSLDTKADVDGNQAIHAAPDTQITDTVTYTGLQPGQKYTLTGTLIDQATGTPIAAPAATEDAQSGGSEEPVTSTVTFTPSTSSGTVRVGFDFDSTGLAGRVLVATEQLTAGEAVLAEHQDLEDQEQTIWIPAIATTATDKTDGDQVLRPSTDTRLVDTVTYSGLQPGRAYTLTGTLIDQATGTPIAAPAATEDAQSGDPSTTERVGKPVTSTMTFTPLESSGSIDIEFDFDSTRHAGITVVVFEDLSLEGRALAEHQDLEDQDQTIWIPKITTLAFDKADGDKKLLHGKTETVVDTVSYTGLQPGQEYELTSTVMDKTTGKPAVTLDGKTVTAKKRFKPEKSSGAVDVEIKFDTTGMNEHSLVIFEDLAKDGQTVAEHQDLEDQDQTVTVTRGDHAGDEASRTLAKTGTDLLLAAGSAGILLAAGLLTLARKHRQPRH
jgi:hypothetical protein